MESELATNLGRRTNSAAKRESRSKEMSSDLLAAAHGLAWPRRAPTPKIIAASRYAHACLALLTWGVFVGAAAAAADVVLIELSATTKSQSVADLSH